MKASIGKLTFIIILIGLLFVACDSSKNNPPVEPLKFETSLPDKISPEGLHNLIAMGDYFLGKTDKITTLSNYNGPSGSGCPSPVCEQKSIQVWYPDRECWASVACTSGVFFTVTFASENALLGWIATEGCHITGWDCNGTWESETYTACCSYDWSYDMYGSGRNCQIQGCWSTN